MQKKDKKLTRPGIEPRALRSKIKDYTTRPMRITIKKISFS